MESADDIDVDMTGEFCWIVVAERSDRGEKACIVDPEVDAAETVHRFGAKGGNGSVVRDIQCACERVLIDIEGWLGARAEGDPHPLAQKETRHAGPKAAAGAGDDRDAAGCVNHVGASLLFL
jgi:hypothetical protein